MKWRRGIGAVLVAGGLVLSGCPDEPRPARPEDPGDWEDEGRRASCGLRSKSTAACGEPEGFHYQGCDLASLGDVRRDGIYTVLYRSDVTESSFFPGVFRLSGDGGLDWFRGAAPTKQVGPGAFFLSNTVQMSTGTRRYSLAGCRAGSGRVYGCYIHCRDGKAVGAGTFEAVKWERRAGEAEAAGLELVSESAVEQGLPVDVYVTRGHAYVVSLPRRGQLGALSVFDVSDPAAPVPRKTFSGFADDNYWNGVWARGDALYVASGDRGVLVFDISDPANPRFLRSHPEGATELDVHTVFVDGERLYAMSPSPEPRTLLFDVREPKEPVLLGHYMEPGAKSDWRVGYPHDALAFEGRLYINHWSGGYVIVDVGDASQMKRLGAYTYPSATSHANAVARYGERVIAFEGGENWGAHVRVLDVTDAARPRRIGEYRLEPNASVHNMVWREGRLYLAHYQHGVRVLDVTVPETPREVAYFNTFRETDPGRGQSFLEGAIGIRVPGDGYVYVVDTARGLLLFREQPAL
jgi:hypothetical protein